MWPFKSKYDKLKREDVVDAICKLEKESKEIEEEILSYQTQIDELMKLGQKEKSRDVQLFYAKKINSKKAEREQNVKRAMYLMYNIQLLSKLKRAIDDNQFFINTSGLALGNLLSDQKGLAKFLNKALNRRISSEQVLTEADDVFKEIEDTYEQNEKIYGKQQADDELLAMFEQQETVESEIDMFATPQKSSNEATEN